MNEKLLEHLKQLCETAAEKYCAWQIGLPTPWTAVSIMAPIVVAFVAGCVTGQP